MSRLSKSGIYSFARLATGIYSFSGRVRVQGLDLLPDFFDGKGATDGCSRPSATLTRSSSELTGIACVRWINSVHRPVAHFSAAWYSRLSEINGRMIRWPRFRYLLSLVVFSFFFPPYRPCEQRTMWITDLSQESNIEVDWFKLSNPFKRERSELVGNLFFN